MLIAHKDDGWTVVDRQPVRPKREAKKTGIWFMYCLTHFDKENEFQSQERLTPAEWGVRRGDYTSTVEVDLENEHTARGLVDVEVRNAVMKCQSV